ncbi:hypothetical protein ACIRJS_16560 [Streptomyces sp. NPDC102340]|uniref:hypothetical protein n=1 Tax=Streptomyces sp. NPDC102340 TaxID=3366156 RepID=UPI0037F491C4
MALTLTAAVDGATATFTVTECPVAGEFTVFTGDGGSLPVTCSGGTGTTAPYTYTMPGTNTYTASITVEFEPRTPTWASVPTWYATWADLPETVETWGDLYVSEESATTDVTVTVDDGAPWPEPRLTLSAVVTDTDTGHNLATFTLENAKTTGITVPLDPGDGTTTVDMEIQADGTATGEKTYTHAGRHVYTATVTVPHESRYATWEDVYTALPTWGAFVADTATWADVTSTSETATCEVEVFVGDGAIWATAIDNVAPPYAQIDLWSGKPDQITSWTVTRHCPGAPALDNTVIFLGDSFSGAVTLSDNEAPWGTPVYYVWTVEYADGSTDTFTSNTISLYGPADFGGCWITDPASGQTMRITIQEWTEREREARQSVLAVMNREDPIVLSDVHTWAHGDIVFIARSKSELYTARQILYSSRLILVRSWAGSSIEAAYMAVGNVTEARLYETDPTAWERSISVEVQDVRPLPATAADYASTWDDLAAAYATWADVDDAFPSWADVISWNPDDVAGTMGAVPLEVAPV